jgi:hypothetical protein
VEPDLKLLPDDLVRAGGVGALTHARMGLTISGMGMNWIKTHPRLTGFLGFIAFGILWYCIASAMQTPEQRALSECTARLQKAAGWNGLSYFEAERLCLQLEP